MTFLSWIRNFFSKKKVCDLCKRKYSIQEKLIEFTEYSKKGFACKYCENAAEKITYYSSNYEWFQTEANKYKKMFQEVNIELMEYKKIFGNLTMRNEHISSLIKNTLHLSVDTHFKIFDCNEDKLVFFYSLLDPATLNEQLQLIKYIRMNNHEIFWFNKNQASKTSLCQSVINDQKGEAFEHWEKYSNFTIFMIK